MPRRPPQSPDRPPAFRLPTPDLKHAIARLKTRRSEVASFDVDGLQVGQPPELKALEAEIGRSLERAFGQGTSDFIRFSPSRYLQWSPTITMAPFGRGHQPQTPISEYKRHIAENINRSIALLDAAIRSLEEELAERSDLAINTNNEFPIANVSSKVFLVHGHDEAAYQSVARFLEKLGLEAIILKEQPDQGHTIIEKFEKFAGNVGFAVVLLTPDDVGVAAAQTSSVPRARQNVIFELGYFVGRLGRGKTCLLRKGSVEIPSDLFGVVYTDTDPQDSWKLGLGKELKAAGLDFDANRLWP